MFWKYNYQGIAWAVFILILFGLPGEQFEKSSLANADLAIHAILFGVLVFLLAVGFQKQSTYRFLKEHTLLKVFAVSILYGVIVEILQGTIFIGRSIEAVDILFNSIGSFLGLALFGSIYGVREYL